jgi:hypothetical protein
VLTRHSENGPDLDDSLPRHGVASIANRGARATETIPVPDVARAIPPVEHEARLKDLLATQAEPNAGLDLDKHEPLIVDEPCESVTLDRLFAGTFAPKIEHRVAAGSIRIDGTALPVPCSNALFR